MVSELMRVGTEGGREIASMAADGALKEDAELRSFRPIEASLDVLVEEGETDIAEKERLISL